MTVTNTDRLSSAVTTSATITAAPQFPVANAGGPYTGIAGTAITFNGSQSSDPRRQALTYNWNQAHQDRMSLLAYARQLRLDLPRFTRDLDSRQLAAELAADEAESEALGVDQTPTLFVAGKKLIGVQSEEMLSGLIAPVGSQPALPVEVAAAAEPDAPMLDRALTAKIANSPTAERGDPKAPVTIVEFTDFQCPFCRAAVEPMEQLMEVRGRKVRWIFRAFPLDFHEHAELAAEAVLAAGEQGKFWAMHDLLFAHQSDLLPNDLRTYARQAGLDLTRFDRALATHRFAGQVAADRALGQEAGGTGTPTFVIDGQMLSGLRSLPELTSMVDARAKGADGALAAQTGTVVPPVAVAEHRVAGSAPDAPLTLTWFIDVRSPLAAGQQELIHALVARYGTRVSVVFKPLPLAIRPDAKLGSAALLAALQQDRFWPMFDALTSRRDTLDRPAVLAIAAGLQLNMERFQTGPDDGLTELNAGLGEAARRGIQGAPVIFLNDQRVDGLQREEFYTRIADGELAKTGGKVR